MKYEMRHQLHYNLIKMGRSDSFERLFCNGVIWAVDCAIEKAFISDFFGYVEKSNLVHSSLSIDDKKRALVDYLKNDKHSMDCLTFLLEILKKHNKKPEVELLLQNVITSKSADSWLPSQWLWWLKIAIEEGKSTFACKMIDEVSHVNLSMSANMALRTALLAKNDDVLQSLLKKGVNLLEAQSGRTPLGTAIHTVENNDVINHILDTMLSFIESNIGLLSQHDQGRLDLIKRLQENEGAPLKCPITYNRNTNPM